MYTKLNINNLFPIGYTIYRLMMELEYYSLSLLLDLNVDVSIVIRHSIYKR